MAKYLRYTLAAVCFAASVGCLALWGWLACSGASVLIAVDGIPNKSIMIELQGNFLGTMTFPARPLMPPISWEIERGNTYFDYLPALVRRHGGFGIVGPIVFFPIWYPALILALAGVAVLRFRRQFSIRSALVAVSVVAALLGMAVVL